MPDTQDRPAFGPTAAAITSEVVRITHEYTGRGPTKAQTMIWTDVVVVLLADILGAGERSLVEQGEAETVLSLRRKLQAAMRDDLIATVEEHTGRQVAAFMSENHIDPDMGVETFVLEPA